jgi:hypothetical protein
MTRPTAGMAGASATEDVGGLANAVQLVELGASIDECSCIVPGGGNHPRMHLDPTEPHKAPHRRKGNAFSTPSAMHDSAALEVDVLVVGAGATGMTAALVRSLDGLDVLLCEKSDCVGGTTATSAGTIWVPGTRQSRAAGFTDQAIDAKRYLDAVIGAAPDQRRDIYLEAGPQVVDYLDRRSYVKYAPYTRHPDYLAKRPGATIGGRPLAAGVLGADFKLVRPPIGEFMALGGMMIGRDDFEPLARPFASLTAFRAATSLIWRHATDRVRYRRGTRLLRAMH